MGKCKANAKYNVLSSRVTNQEKSVIDGMKRNTRKSVTVLMREAMLHYTSSIDSGSNR